MMIYDNLYATIQGGEYQLSDMLERILTLYSDRAISTDQRETLLSLARKNANPEEEYPDDLRVLYEALATRMTALEGRVDALEGSGTTPPADEWPEYQQPNGAHDAYYTGYQITYNGQRYVCIAPAGTACVWPPDVYPAYWQLQE